jgi:dTDP-glucose pyrophosphorylase
MTDLFSDLIAGGTTVHAHQLQGDWADVGRVDELRRARGETG